MRFSYSSKESYLALRMDMIFYSSEWLSLSLLSRAMILSLTFSFY